MVLYYQSVGGGGLLFICATSALLLIKMDHYIPAPNVFGVKLVFDIIKWKYEEEIIIIIVDADKDFNKSKL